MLLKKYPARIFTRNFFPGIYTDVQSFVNSSIIQLIKQSRENDFICIIDASSISACSIFTFADGTLRLARERERKANCLVGNTFRLGYTFRMQQKLHP
jgi:hypothetical protein